MEKQLLNFELDPVRPDNRIVFSAYTLSKAQDIESFQMICAAKILQEKSLTCQCMES